jgi:acyl carrier protein
MQALVTSMQKLLKQKLNIRTAITPNTDLRKDLELADWELQYLLNAVENKWHVSVSDTEQIGNVAQLIAVVNKTR